MEHRKLNIIFVAFVDRLKLYKSTDLILEYFRSLINRKIELLEDCNYILTQYYQQ